MRRRPGISLFRLLFAALLALAWCVPAPTASAAVTPIIGPGASPGSLSVPGPDAVDSEGNLYVLDVGSGDQTLNEYTNNGTFMTSASSADGTAFNFRGAGGFGGLAIDPSSDSAFVADSGNSRIVELNSSLNYVSTVETGTAPVALAVANGTLYALSIQSNQYVLSEWSEGGVAGMTKTFTDGSAAGDLAAPLTGNGLNTDHIAVDGDGTIYITDAGNQRVIELDGSTLEPLMPAMSGFTGYPVTIAIDTIAGATQVYVGDDVPDGEATVHRFSPSGNQLGSLQVFYAQGGLALDPNGNVFVSSGISGADVYRVDTTPDPAIVPTPTTGLTSQTVTFTGSAETDLWAVADYSWDLDNSGTFSTDTGTSPNISQQFNTAGTYPIGLQVTGTNGRVASTTINYVVGNSQAAFTSPTQALTHTAATFDGSPSVIPYSTVTDYAWDFDGSGSYALDGGTSPTITYTFAAPGTYTVQLRVTRSGGRVDTASGQIVVAPAPPPGRVGVVINDGDYATNDPNVKIDPVWPGGATQILISNNGGFGASGNAMTLPLAAEIPWTLERTGDDRLPKTVYVRFLGAGMDDINFTDDIILDETAPTIQSAQLVGGAGGGAASSARAKTRSYRIKVKAKDRIVGVCAVDASARKSGGTVVTVKNCRHKGILQLAKTLAIRSARQPRYVRVRNSAGSWSRWLKLRV